MRSRGGCWHGPRLLLIVGLAAGITTSCRPSELVVADLAQSLPLADPQRELERIDFGTEEARPFLLEGWLTSERAGDVTFSWALGPAARVRFYLVEPRALTLVARCWPFPFGHGKPQTVEIIVNGRHAGQVVLESAPADYRVQVAAAGLRGGENVLEFRFSQFLRTAAAGEWPLAVAWDFLEIEPIRDAELPSAQTAPAAIVLPGGSAAVYHLELPPDSFLAWDEVRPLGSATARLILRARALEDGVTNEKVVGSEERGTWQLTSSTQSGVVELTLAATPGSQVWGEGVQVLEPQVRARQAALARERADKPVLRAGPAERGRRRAQNVLVYCVDTLRADHLGVYGYPRDTSPQLDLFAQQALVFLHARANTSWTRPAVATILSGLAPDVHGVVDRDHALASDTPYIPAILQAAGFATGAVVTSGNLKPGFGFDRGFDHYGYLPATVANPTFTAPAERMVDDLIAWLEDLAPGRRFFLYAHPTDPHAPYAPPSPYRERFDRLDGRGHRLITIDRLAAMVAGRAQPTPTTRTNAVDLYDAEIAFGDEHFGRLVDHLRRSGRLDDTLIVFTSDHGEEFLEHDSWGHGLTLYEEQLRVPLLLRLPGGEHAGLRVESEVQHLDLAPTILEALGIEAPQTFAGRSLVPRRDEATASRRERATLAHLDLDGRRIESVSFRAAKLIRNRATHRPRPFEELFDLRSDPKESHSRLGEQPVLASYLRMLLREHARLLPLSRAPRVVLSEETQKQLRALGYVR